MKRVETLLQRFRFFVFFQIPLKGQSLLSISGIRSGRKAGGMSVKFSDVKVHNEMELCEIESPEEKEKIERALLREQISFYIKWQSRGFLAGLFFHGRETAILCVNDAQKEAAIVCIGELEKNKEVHVKFIGQKVDRIFF